MSQRRFKQIIVGLIVCKFCLSSLTDTTEFVQRLTEINAYKLVPYFLLLLIHNAIVVDHRLMHDLADEANRSPLPKLLLVMFRVAAMFMFGLLIISLKN